MQLHSPCLPLLALLPALRPARPAARLGQEALLEALPVPRHLGPAAPHLPLRRFQALLRGHPLALHTARPGQEALPVDPPARAAPRVARRAPLLLLRLLQMKSPSPRATLSWPRFRQRRQPRPRLRLPKRRGQGPARQPSPCLPLLVPPVAPLVRAVLLQAPPVLPAARQGECAGVNGTRWAACRPC